MNNKQKTHRLFFVLWPSQEVRRSIVQLTPDLPVQKAIRVMQPHNLHITLHFIGQVTASTKDCMHAAARSVNAEKFEMDLNYFGVFPRAKIFWMGARNTPVQLERLHTNLGAAIESCGYKSDARVFAPHVTLLRKYSCTVPDPIKFSIPWKIEEFALIESVTSRQGVNYQLIEKYPLA